MTAGPSCLPERSPARRKPQDASSGKQLARPPTRRNMKVRATELCFSQNAEFLLQEGMRFPRLDRVMGVASPSGGTGSGGPGWRCIDCSIGTGGTGNGTTGTSSKRGRNRCCRGRCADANLDAATRNQPPPVTEYPDRPILALHVLWHPSFTRGKEFAEKMREHYMGDLFETVGGDSGISVVHRSEPEANSDTPLPIVWNTADMTAVVVMQDSFMCGDSGWRRHLRDISTESGNRYDCNRVIPVIMDKSEPMMGGQALIRDGCRPDDADCRQWLFSSITHEFCRMLRNRIEHGKSSDEKSRALERQLEKTEIFISHSKHDPDGERISREMRRWIHDCSGFSTFLDIIDTPPGIPFEEVFNHKIGSVILVVVQTDTFSSRAWCRREVMEAKRHRIPMIVINCLRDFDPEGFAYLGNVPVIRQDPGKSDGYRRIAYAITNEVFRSRLWEFRVLGLQMNHPSTLFVARPPELLTLAILHSRTDGQSKTIVHPEPPMNGNELELLSGVSRDLRILTLKEWREEECM